MNARILNFQEVVNAGRWRPELFIELANEYAASDWPMMALKDLVEESGEAISPLDYPENKVIYIGLENVESVTGEALGLLPVDKQSIRSRSKVFSPGYILYGKLRPYLRKALLVDDSLGQGICSTEFIVVRPRAELIIPSVLRAILVSERVTEQLTRHQTGAALPRISSKDFLAVRVPLPPLEIQKELAERIAKLTAAVNDARKQINAYPNQLEAEVGQALYLQPV